MSYQLDSLDTSSTQVDIMELLYDDSISIFQSINKGFRDSVNLLHRKTDPNYNIIYDNNYRSLKRLKNFYSINRKGNNIWVLDTYTYGGLRSDGYQVYEENLKLDWKLTGKIDSLGGYLVQQALLDYGGRQWDAWFAPDIPIDAGPYKFFGLPGLIIHIQDTRSHWKFTLTSITSNTKRAVLARDEIPLNVIKTDKKAFFKNRKRYLENRTAIDEESGNIIVTSAEARQKAIEDDKINAAKNNNWIELYP